VLSSTQGYLISDALTRYKYFQLKFKGNLDPSASSFKLELYKNSKSKPKLNTTKISHQKVLERLETQLKQIIQKKWQ
jgi:hypothetical protein